MNYQLTLRILGGLLVFLGAMLLTPIPFSLYFGDGNAWVFLLSAAIAAGVGALLERRFKCRAELTHREGFAIVTFGWTVFALFGALPYVISGHVLNPLDAFFESMSGFTTTGSTVITDLTQVPHSILFWRSLTQWLGGMGIIVLSLAILPFLGVGGMQLFEAEVPGPTADRLSPRIQDTAKVLWGVYVIITAAEIVLLWVPSFFCSGGMNFYEAICHALTTMATGGFSTRNESIAAFDSYVQVVITVFMFLAGVNFSLHFHALRGDFRRYPKSQEFLFFVAVCLCSILAAMIFNFGNGLSLLVNLRDAAFTTVSIITTTGYATADFETWPAVMQVILLSLMFLGGCAGSTGGGMKVVRLYLVLKHAYLQISRLIHPKEIRVLKLDRKAVSPEVIQSVLGFVALFITLFLVGTLIVAAQGLDLVTAGSAVIACLGNIGPGLGEVGPTDHFIHIPAVGKVVLALLMLIGRLEVFTVLVLFFPSFWRK